MLLFVSKHLNESLHSLGETIIQTKTRKRVRKHQCLKEHNEGGHPNISLFSACREASKEQDSEELQPWGCCAGDLREPVGITVRHGTCLGLPELRKAASSGSEAGSRDDFATVAAWVVVGSNRLLALLDGHWAVRSWHLLVGGG